jgi:hypothetical protein
LSKTQHRPNPARAKASLERNPSTWAVSPTILAAVKRPQPTMANSDGATIVTRSFPFLGVMGPIFLGCGKNSPPQPNGLRA